MKALSRRSLIVIAVGSGILLIAGIAAAVARMQRVAGLVSLRRRQLPMHDEE